MNGSPRRCRWEGTLMVEDHLAASGASRAPAPLRIWLMGQFRVAVGDRVVPEGSWRLRRARHLVKLLSLSPRHRLHREQVMALLWADLDPRAAVHNLHQALYVARRALEPQARRGSYLRLEGDLLVLCPNAPIWVDVEAFDAAARRARTSGDPDAYQAALDLYTGDLLPEDRYEDWVTGRRQAAREERPQLMLELAGLYEARGDCPRAIEALRQVVDVDPAREEAHQGLMRLYALTGRRQQALRQYKVLEQALRAEIEAEPDPESRGLYQEILAGRVPRSEPKHGAALAWATDRPDRPPPHNLPTPLTSFIGRERETAEVRRLLGAARLVTLTGAGGSGKTRLALRVASDVLMDYPDGVWLVDLAPLANPRLVPQAVAAVLAVRERPDRPLVETLVAALRPRRLLLVVDNCEHLIAACAELVETLLRECLNLRVLVTSREPLRISGENVWRVPSLPVPDAERLPPLEDLLRNEAVQLLHVRAQSVLPSFAIGPEDAAAAAVICQRLDGMPLAIELAAARVPMLSLRQMAARLDAALPLLTRGSRTAQPRQQTLRATLDWSHTLLSEPERALFRRLAAFAGGFTLDAAEAVGAGEGIHTPETLDLLSQLVDKSLVVSEVDADGAARYRLLEPIRQYAQEHLIASGEAEAVRARHAAYYVRLSEQAEPELAGPRQIAWLTRLDRERDNLRAALQWSRQPGGSVELGLRLAGALWRFWWVRGYFTEGRAQLETLLADPGAAGLGSVKAKALYALGVVIFRHANYATGDQEVARRYLRQCLGIYREQGDSRQVAATLLELGRIGIELGEYGQARPLLEESHARYREFGDRHSTALALSSLGWLTLFAGDYDAARPLLEESLRDFHDLGDLLYVGICLYFLGRLACDQGDYAVASARFREILDTLPLAEYRWGAPFVLEGFARLAAARGMAAQALRFAGAADALRETIGSAVGPSWQADLDRRLEPARRALSPEAAQAAWEAGRSLTIEQALAEVTEL